MIEVYKEPLYRRYCHNAIGGRGLFAYSTVVQFFIESVMFRSMERACITTSRLLKSQ